MRAKHHCWWTWDSKCSDTAWNCEAVGVELGILFLPSPGFVLLGYLAAVGRGAGEWSPLSAPQSQWQVTSLGFATGKRRSSQELSLVCWTCFSDLIRACSCCLPLKVNQPIGLRSSKTTKSPSAECWTLGISWQGPSLRAFPGSVVNKTACDFWASIHAKARLFLEKRKRWFIF